MPPKKDKKQTGKKAGLDEPLVLPPVQGNPRTTTYAPVPKNWNLSGPLLGTRGRHLLQSYRFPMNSVAKMTPAEQENSVYRLSKIKKKVEVKLPGPIESDQESETEHEKAFRELQDYAKNLEYDRDLYRLKFISEKEKAVQWKLKCVSLVKSLIKGEPIDLSSYMEDLD